MCFSNVADKSIYQVPINKLERLYRDKATLDKAAIAILEAEITHEGIHMAETNTGLRAIPCYLMRGGTSRGPFFLASDLPTDIAQRDRVLLAVMGSPDQRQIDGLGGANPLTSKVGIVSTSTVPGVALDFLFAQLQPANDIVDTTPNCGNMLAAVVPFALERSLITAQGESTTVRVLTLNTGMQCDITVLTPGGKVRYDGETKIDGVPGTSAPIAINFIDTAGSVCSSLLPSGNVQDLITLETGNSQIQLAVTCIDNGMPMVLLRAADVDRSGYESVTEMNADSELKTLLEALRIKTGHLMGLGDVTDKSYPKMCLLAPPKDGGSISTRCFIPHVCHDAIGVLAAVTVATACILDGSVASKLAVISESELKNVSVEHPSGEFSVELAIDPNNSQAVTRAALLRTARLIMRGEVMINETVWKGNTYA